MCFFGGPIKLAHWRFHDVAVNLSLFIKLNDCRLNDVAVNRSLSLSLPLFLSLSSSLSFSFSFSFSISLSLSLSVVAAGWYRLWGTHSCAHAAILRAVDPLCGTILPVEAGAGCWKPYTLNRIRRPPPTLLGGSWAVVSGVICKAFPTYSGSPNL